MNTVTKQNFQLPKLGSMLDTLNQTFQWRTSLKRKTFGRNINIGSSLVSGHWRSFAELRRHRCIGYVHHIRVQREGPSVRLSMMFFKPPKKEARGQKIDLRTVFVHTLLIEHTITGDIAKVYFGAERGQQEVQKIAMSQTLEGHMAQKFVATLSHGWLRSRIPADEMAMIEKNTYHSVTQTFDLSRLEEPTGIMIERAATMHQRMSQNYDDSSAERAVDQAVLHVYEKDETPLKAAEMFNVKEKEVLLRKDFYDHIAEALGRPASKLVANHLVQSEHDEAMPGEAPLYRTPDMALMN